MVHIISQVRRGGLLYAAFLLDKGVIRGYFGGGFADG